MTTTTTTDTSLPTVLPSRRRRRSPRSTQRRQRRPDPTSSTRRPRANRSVPELWNVVSPIGTVVAHGLVPMKVPLDCDYDHAIARSDRWNLNTATRAWTRMALDVKLVVDLTNTSRYYPQGASTLADAGVRYVKLPVQGFRQCPTDRDVSAFVSIIRDFRAEFPSSHVAVHCTHGLNRTGYLIVRYLLDQVETETGKMTVTTALKMFQQARAPGLIKYSYVEELYRRFGRDDETIQYPELPPWAQEKYSKA